MIIMQPNSMKLLIVEDETDVATALARSLVRNGYAVDVANNAAQATEWLLINEYDLMVLDLNLPDADGLDVCRMARKEKPALLILILTARGMLKDIVSGLDNGADDYLTKPFHLQVILARIRALLRRDMRCRDPLIKIKDICLDPAERVVWKSGRHLDLTRKEFSILEYLMRHPGEVISQEDLLEHVWSAYTNPLSNTIRVHIQSLRKKLGEDSNTQQYIATVIGGGYRFLKPEDSYGQNIQ
jgi:DNA-binding response OmpR family regulator